METFGERLARLMHERGWTQLETAQKLGVSQALVSHYLSGKHHPLPRTVAHIAERLGVSVSELTGKKGTASSKGGRVSGTAGVTAPADARMLAVLKNLKKRWNRGERERGAIRHLVAMLFVDDADDVLAWFDDRAGSQSGTGTDPEK